jgi:hypothetical protein
MESAETMDAARERVSRGARPARRGRPFVALERVLLGALTLILSANLWTGFPLLALWIGLQCTGGELLSMGGVVVVVLTLAALLSAGVLVLTRISLRYDRLARRPPAVRQPAPWLLSMNAAKAKPARGRGQVGAIEKIVVLSVVAAVVAFEVWFFFLTTSSVPG